MDETEARRVSTVREPDVFKVRCLDCIFVNEIKLSHDMMIANVTLLVIGPT